MLLSLHMFHLRRSCVCNTIYKVKWLSIYSNFTFIYVFYIFIFLDGLFLFAEWKYFFTFWLRRKIIWFSLNVRFINTRFKIANKKFCVFNFEGYTCKNLYVFFLNAYVNVNYYFAKYNATLYCDIYRVWGDINNYWHLSGVSALSTAVKKYKHCIRVNVSRSNYSWASITRAAARLVLKLKLYPPLIDSITR